MKPSTESVRDYSSEFDKVYTTKDLAIELVTRRCSNLFNAYVKEIETSSDNHVALLMFAFEGSYEEITSMELNILEKYKGEPIRRRNSEHLTELTETPVSGVRIWNCDGHVIYVPECFKIVVDDETIKREENSEKIAQPGKQNDAMSESTKSNICHGSQLQAFQEKQMEDHEEHTSCSMEKKEQEFQNKCDTFVEQLSGYFENLCNKLTFHSSDKVVKKAFVQKTDDGPIIDKRYVNYNQVVSPDTSSFNNQNPELELAQLYDPQFLMEPKSGNSTIAELSSELEKIEETGETIEGGKKKHNKTKNKPGVSNTQSVPNSSNEVINTANDESKRIIQNSVHYMGILEKAYLKKCRTKCGKCDACVGFSNLKIEYEEKVNETLLSSAETDKMAEQFESQVKSQEENTDSKEPEQTLPGIVQDGNGKSASHQQKPRGSSMNDSINRATASSSHYPTMQQNGDHVIRSSPRPIFPANIHLKRTVIFTAVNPFHKIPDTPMILSRRERTTANRRARQQAVPSAPPLEDEDFDTAQLTLSNILKVKKL